MLKEVIIVEGKSDIAAVSKAVEAEIIATGGFALNSRTMAKIAVAYEKRGIIILTDPDHAGERIRKRLTKEFPLASHAFIPLKEATADGDIGVEQASVEAIRAALLKVRTQVQVVVEEFVFADLYANDLAGVGSAGLRRAKLGELLGLGYANARQFLVRLNNYGVSRQEFVAGLSKLEE